jgi:predicted amidohydrolase YtcJ
VSRTLFHNGVVHAGRPGERPTALAVDAGRIVFVGDEDRAAAYDNADEVVDLAGALLAPGFVDAHVHTVRTGFALTGLDLTGSPSLAATLDELAAFDRKHPEQGVLVGQGWDETGWPEHRTPTGEELERAAPSRRTYLTRVDGHSSVVSPVLAALVPGLADLDGWTPDGRVERDAHHAVRAVLEGLISPDDRRDAARAACRAMAAQGVTAFHENAAPHIGPEHEIEMIRSAAGEVGLRATIYWGELMAVETARRLGAAGLAGDLIADGAFGSRTAALSQPYADRPGTCGHAYISAEQVRDHVVACTSAGLQAGFHCIGDAALEAIREGLEAAERELGASAIRGGRHRLEHVEMPSPAMVQTMSRLGITASVQPMFDALWGGPDGMYAERLGERWRATNPFRALADAGVTLAFGSDSPVTPLGPWVAVRAAVQHHAEEQRLAPATAFAAHTGGAQLAVGADADLAVWDHLPDLTPGADLPRLLRTVAAGRTIHTNEDAA